MAYIVTAGRVSAATNVGNGRAVIDFYRGAVLPDDVPDETVQAFLRDGSVVDEDAPESVEDEVDTEGDEVDLSKMDRDQLLALAEERGIQVDKRWGPDKLIAALQGE